MISVAELNDMIATAAVDSDDDEDAEVDIVSEMKGDRALEALKADASTQDDIKISLKTIEEIAQKSKVNKHMLRKRNCAPILIKVAREQFTAQPMVAVECFRVLLLVTAGDNSVEEGLASLGVLETTVDILNMYTADAALGELCFRFLRRMTATSVGNVARLGELQCVDLVLTALTTHATAHQVCANADADSDSDTDVEIYANMCARDQQVCQRLSRSDMPPFHGRVSRQRRCM